MPRIEDIAVFDSSSLLEIRRDKVPVKARPAILRKMTALVAQGRLIYPVQVVEELERWVPPVGKPPRPDVILEWAQKEKAKAADGHGRLYEESKAVLAEVPTILDPEKTGQEEADPYVLGLAVRTRDSGRLCTVITEERKDMPVKMSMNTACGILRLSCLPLLGFLLVNGIWKPGDPD